MKFISGMFKFFAVGIMVVVIFALPVTLLMRDLGNLLFSPSTMAALVEENVFDADVLAGMAEYYAQDAFSEMGEDNPYGVLIAEGVGNLSHEDWVEVINLITPPQLIAETFEQGIRGYFQWLDGPDQFPQIVIDLRPWKNNLKRNSVSVIELVINELPQCTPGELEQFAGLATGGGIAAVPVCRPPEPFYSLLIDQAAETLPQQVEQMPNSIDLGKQIRENQDGLTDVKQRLLSARRGMLRSWLVAAALFIAAVPMGARSIEGAFKWTGWPLVLAGIFGLLLAVLIMLSGEALAVNISSAVIEGVPPPLIEPVKSVMTGWTSSLARPSLVRSVILAILGGGAIITGVIIGRSMGKKDDANITSSTPSGGGAPEEAGRLPGTPQKKEREVDDDSRPTGMFG